METTKVRVNIAAEELREFINHRLGIISIDLLRIQDEISTLKKLANDTGIDIGQFESDSRENKYWFE